MARICGSDAELHPVPGQKAAAAAVHRAVSAAELGVSALCGLFPSPADNLTILFQAQLTGEAVPESAARSAARDLIPAITPTALISLGAILVSLFGCAALLKKKVSL